MLGVKCQHLFKKKKKNEHPELPKQMLALESGKGKANSTSGGVIT